MELLFLFYFILLPDGEEEIIVDHIGEELPGQSSFSSEEGQTGFRRSVVLSSRTLFGRRSIAGHDKTIYHGRIEIRDRGE